MNEQDYKPYLLETVTEISDGHFVLKIDRRSYQDSIDHYTEIHLQSVNITLERLKEKAGAEIFIDIISPSILEIYEGWHYYESCSDGPVQYTAFEWKILPKTSSEWKVPYLQHDQKLKSKLKSLEKPYKEVRDVIIKRFKVIYSLCLNTGETGGLTLNEINSSSIFRNLLNLFESNPPGDGLNFLINPDYNIQNTPTDWREAYNEKALLLQALEKIDLNDYNAMTEHMIKRYSHSFNHMLPNLKYNYKNIDEDKYRAFFQLLINHLRASKW